MKRSGCVTAHRGDDPRKTPPAFTHTSCFSSCPQRAVQCALKWVRHIPLQLLLYLCVWKGKEEKHLLCWLWLSNLTRCEPATCLTALISYTPHTPHLLAYCTVTFFSLLSLHTLLQLFALRLPLSISFHAHTAGALSWDDLVMEWEEWPASRLKKL